MGKKASNPPPPLISVDGYRTINENPPPPKGVRPKAPPGPPKLSQSEKEINDGTFVRYYMDGYFSKKLSVESVTRY